MKIIIQILIALMITAPAIADVSPNQIPVPKDVMQTIKALAHSQYPDDYSMQAYIIDKEVEAYKSLYAWGFNNRENKVAEEIFRKAQAEYPDEYSMQWYIVQREVEAINRIYGE